MTAETSSRHASRLQRPADEPLRCLQLLDSTARRGAEVFATQLAEGLRARGHVAVCAALRRGLSERGVPVNSVLAEPTQTSRRRGTAVEILETIDRMRASVIQANGGSTVKHAAIAARLRPRRRWRLVYRNIGDPAAWLTDPLRRAFYRHVVWPKVDGIIAVSEQSRAGLLRVYGPTRKPIEVVYQGVDESSLVPRAEREDVRANLATGQDAVVLIWVGAMSPEKRPDRALRMMSRLRSRGERVMLWFVGDGRLREGMAVEAERLGVAGRVRWLGVVDDVGTYLHAADCYLLTSDTEGVPGALLEAMTAGLPAVTTNVGGIPEVVDEGRTGFMVDPGRDDVLTDRIELLIGDVELRRLMGTKARAEGLLRFGMDTCIDSYVRFYRSLVDKTSGGAHAAR